MSADSPAAAHYQEGDALRLRGELAEAEAAYKRTSQAGGDPQPGLSLLRLAQGRHEQAGAAIRGVERATEAALSRVHLLPAFVEIMPAVGDLDEARRGSGCGTAGERRAVGGDPAARLTVGVE